MKVKDNVNFTRNQRKNVNSILCHGNINTLFFFSFVALKILTKDSVTVHVDAIMYYKVYNAISAISNVDDYGQSTRLLAATTLRFQNQII